MPTNTYESPLSSRYASDEMLYLFSADKKFSTWRRLWVALARAEKELGLDITDAQIAEMEAHVTDIDYDYAAKMEKELRHDVMAHVHAFGKVCPKAFPIIHLGATSCYVGDNTDIILMREGLELIRAKLLRVIGRLSDFADQYKALPTLGFTHFQPAQLTTVGKRATLWINELLYDLDEVRYRLLSLKLLGSKGTTGTQASFMELFGGDHDKIKKMEELIAKEMDFDGVVPVSGQTYSRKIDAGILATLSGIAQSAGKFATDMRLLSHLKECEEPFEGKQIGSSAMPYKRNPMRCERICALARYVINDSLNGAMTSYNQWFERTLDDSANKRLSVPEAFLAVDAILNICLNVASGIKVYPKVIEKHIQDELPFMATENIMMRAVKKGGNRQELHEAIRVHSVAAGNTVKEQGNPNDLAVRIAGDPLFGLTEDEIEAELDPVKYIGRAPEQVAEFLEASVRPKLEGEKDLLSISETDLKV
jgi:adenylosuccinate lyase